MMTMQPSLTMMKIVKLLACEYSLHFRDREVRCKRHAKGDTRARCGERKGGSSIPPTPYSLAANSRVRLPLKMEMVLVPSP